MARFVAARLLHTVLILFGVSLVAFALIHMIPGNPLDILLPPEAPKSVVDRLRSEFGFDRPLYIQYLSWLGRVLRGNLGTSVFTGREVTHELLRALGNTLVIAVPAAVLGFGLGIALGAAAAFNYGKATDRLISAFVILGLSVPHFWLAIVLVILFAVEWNLLPAEGMGGTGGFPTSWDSLRYLILPVLTLSMIPMGVVGRMVRSTVLEILGNEFPTALRAKGLMPRRIVFHVLKNAAPPTLAVMGLQLGYLLGGSILVETVFNWPGCGQFMNLAIFRRDIPVLQGTVLVLASFFVLINLVVDLVQALIDPRMRR
ncbi:MAG TPA: ABC transporter permease [Stellaceae bacterium]|jgi:peptide/nickel transport system permease protein|nr:ABC transporter permease [Stellaceae bacterium]